MTELNFEEERTKSAEIAASFKRKLLLFESQAAAVRAQKTAEAKRKNSFWLSNCRQLKLQLIALQASR